ncbi:ABC transporter permease [Streptomyces rimosus]|uniref:ABC transporter permease n=1 Tax=Streptomyces rimosus TaxID=1927 RepID=UPI0005189D4F|nr:ABC transporter permease [Streptomyces rimosus]
MTTTVLTKAPAVRSRALHTFAAMMARDARVLRRNFVMSAVRIVIQPLLFVFVFAYVLPKVGGGGAGPGGEALSTIMVPGLVGSSMVLQAMAAVTFPLVMELSGPGAIEDRALAPVSVRVLGLQKILSAVVEGLVAGVLVFPVVLLVHAQGQGPAVSVANWPMLVFVLLAGAVLAAAIGMYLATRIDPRQIQVLFTLVMFPAMMLGCVYFPWSSLDGTPWLQIAVLFNPMVYMNEGLRAVLTPQVGHMPTWAFLTALAVGAAGFVWLAMRSFARRVTQ